MKLCKNQIAVALLSGCMALVPALGVASSESQQSELQQDEPTFFAFSSMEKPELLTLEPMQFNELQQVQGEYFNLVFNFALVPQINICLFCVGVNQSNFAMVFGINNLP